MGVTQRRDFQKNFAATNELIDQTKRMMYKAAKDKKIGAKEREIFTKLIEVCYGIQGQMYSTYVAMDWVK